jgi:hypothetical protein
LVNDQNPSVNGKQGTAALSNKKQEKITSYFLLAQINRNMLVFKQNFTSASKTISRKAKQK